VVRRSAFIALLCGDDGEDMWHFVFPENGQPAHMFNRMLDGPFDDQQDAIEKFVIRYSAQGWQQTPAKEVAFLNQRTGEVLVLRQVTA
jgi:hypothetical protein